MDMSKWDPKRMWRRAGKGFVVEVFHSVWPAIETGAYQRDAENKWCVYAYIYPSHAMFERFEGPDMWQPAASSLPLHGGPSYLEYPMTKGEITCVKVGCDYSHYGDERFADAGTADEAWKVFGDAEQLFDWLDVGCVVPSTDKREELA